MKVCLAAMNIVPYFLRDASAHYGGAEVQASVLAEGFKEAGAEVVLVVSDLHEGVKLPYSAENAFLSDKGLPVLRFFHPRLTGIWKALGRADADVYYQHCAGMISLVIALFCRIKGKIFVYGAGSNTDFSFWASHVKGFRDKVMFFSGLKLAHGIVAQNQLQKKLCKKKIGKPSKVLPCAVSIDEEEKEEGADLVLWVGAMREVKRPDLFVELAGRLPDVRFVMVGGEVASEKGVSERVMEKASGLRNLELKGRLLHHEVLELLRKSALLVNTSKVEGFPNVYLEAWKYGVPVVSFTDVDGLMTEEGAGIICNDLDDMASSIERLMNDPKERMHLGEKGKELVRDRFAAGVLAKEYLGFFDELIKKKSL